MQNRVTPFGEIVAVTERGTFMGNRGCLHSAAQELTGRRWTTRRWITCLLEFKGRHREVMQPGHYTELFFLDEATAFAAGHRPCAECRRDDYKAFREAWARARGLARLPSADEIDEVLHSERVAAGGVKPVWKTHLRRLPDGVLVTRAGRDIAWMLHRGRLLEWTSAGYRASAALATGVFDVLTPRKVVLVFESGYAPVVHTSAAGG